MKNNKIKPLLIFECLNPEYNDRPKKKKKPEKNKQLLVIKDKPETRQEQSLFSRQQRLAKLLAIKDPTPQKLKSIRKIRRRIERMSGVVVTKKYKNKVLKRLKQKKCPREYNSYIKSKFWEKRKNSFFQKFLKMCARCGSKKYIHLHHKMYYPALFGDEPDNHLCPLCETCHKIFHEKYGVKKDMSLETDLFISSIE